MCEGNIAHMTSGQRIRFLKMGLIYRLRGPKDKTRYGFTEKGKKYLKETM